MIRLLHCKYRSQCMHIGEAFIRKTGEKKKQTLFSVTKPPKPFDPQQKLHEALIPHLFNPNLHSIVPSKQYCEQQHAEKSLKSMDLGAIGSVLITWVEEKA